LDRTIFEETLNLSNRAVNLLKFADRSPVTTVPHAKVARAFDMFRKLGMRHMCVIDDEHRLVGILTRKDLMTYKIRENIMSPKAEAMIHQFLYRWRKKREARLGKEASGALKPVKPPEGLSQDNDVSETTGLCANDSWDTFKFPAKEDTEALQPQPPPSPLA
jgi:CBS domain-containing protein